MTEFNNPLLDCIETETGPDPTHAVIWLHGLGADGGDFAPLVPQLQSSNKPAIRFVFPHAPVRPITINNGFAMRAWYDIFSPDLVRREDELGIRASQQSIEALIARENSRGIPTEKIVLAGFSQGCALTLHTGLRLNQKLAGMIALSGYLPLADSLTSERHSANQDTPIFLAHGTLDPVVNFSRAQATRKILTDLNYPVTWETYAMPHAVCPQEIVDITRFLRQVLI
ncbi:MAG: dienelactone hydrolase family protein [Burkholderiaceae bacterium]